MCAEWNPADLSLDWQFSFIKPLSWQSNEGTFRTLEMAGIKVQTHTVRVK